MTGRSPVEQRLLILAPIGKDASLIISMLGGAAPSCVTCADFPALLARMAEGAAAVLLTEEALAGYDAQLAAALRRQPPWSDLPVLVLTRSGASSGTAESALTSLGNVTLIERPVRVAALASAVRTALRARERQYQIREYVQEHERADRRKDEFLATLAHELRNPLAPIRSALDLLRLSRVEGTAPGIVEAMERQVTHMVRLVDDMMDVSRMTRGKIRLRVEPVDLADAVRSAIEISRPLVAQMRHQLDVQLPPEPVTVQGDAVRLAQVFSNLINNAAKYTAPGGRIDVAVHAAGGRARIDVTDNGIGIPAEALPNLFDMFYQADGATRRAQGGLGIGLTLVRTLIEMHGGTVRAHSDGADRGSRFTVELPLAAQRGATAPDAGRSALAPLGTRPRVLVVDDNHDAADTLALLLRALGAEVRVAHDGPAALAAVDAFRPAALFLDIGMPGMDGYEVAQRIRARHNGGSPLLVALTGWGQDRDRRRSAEAGFTHHLVKPADAGHLREVLDSLPR